MKIDAIYPEFMKICTVQADLSGMQSMMVKKEGKNGPYWDLMYTICIRFGTTELEVYTEWDLNVSSYVMIIATAADECPLESRERS